jgi:anti-anti-sigma factor
MAIEFYYDAAGNRLAVRGELTIYHAAEAAQQLRGYRDLLVDLSEVSEMDAAGLQLLLAARRDANLQWAALSEPVSDILRLAGLADSLETQP